MSWSIATWNVNSLRARADHVVKWLQSNPVDVLAIQETKVIDELFPVEVFAELGYHLYYSGQKSYNGVAIFTKNKATNIVNTLVNIEDSAKRIMAMTIDGVRVINVYVPNGQSLESEKFQYKRKWLDALLIYINEELASNNQLVLLGDFNIAPADIDVYDPSVWQNKILTSDTERSYLKQLNSLGLNDVFRTVNPSDNGFSWWDYRAGSFRRGLGLRIDLLFATNIMLQYKVKSYVDIEPRSWDKPSDHTPVIAEFDYLP